MFAGLLLACASPTAGHDETSDIAAVVEEMRSATTTAVVTDLFRFTATVASGLRGGTGGCAWTFEFGPRNYEASECGMPSDVVTIYHVADQDLPHRGAPLPLAVPLVPVGVLRLGDAGCPDALRVEGAGRLLLAACGEAEDWTATLHTTTGTFVLAGERHRLEDPSARMREVIRLSRSGATVILQHDVLDDIERAESVLRVEARGAVFRMEGFAGSVGPEYAAVLDGAPAGTIAWRGTAGFVVSGAVGEPATGPETRRLRAGEHLIRSLSRIGSGIATLLSLR